MESIDQSLITLQVRRIGNSTEEAQLSTVTPAIFSSSIPWRRFRAYRKARHYSGNYWCATTGAPVDYESRLELANLIELDFDSRTSWVRAQPFLISGVDGQRVRHHIPDYLVDLVGGGLRVIDVKPAAMLDHPKVHESLTWSRRVIEAVGWEYRVVSEADARRHANIRFLAGYRRSFQFLPEETEAVRLAIDRPMTISAATSKAIEILGASSYARSIVLHLLWSGRLQADLAQTLQGSSIVTASS